MGRGKDTWGLTLTELVIAMTILIVVIGSTMVIFRGITRAWRTGQVRTERYQQARLLFDLFSRELASNVLNPRYPLIGFDVSQEERLGEASSADELFFTGTLPGRGGFVERGYWVNDRQQLICHDEEPADGDYQTGTSELCGSQVLDLDFSYFDGSEWVDRWDARPEGTQAGRLPKAAHVILVIGGEAPRRFETVIYVPTSS